eukprot:SAG22_NODE_4100_length_1387_cov_1.064441_1_plen_107_part_10
MESWLWNPEHIATILWKSLPSTAPFFISYILLKTGSFALQLCRLSDIFSYLTATATARAKLSPRQKRAALGMEPVENPMGKGCIMDLFALHLPCADRMTCPGLIEKV